MTADTCSWTGGTPQLLRLWVTSAARAGRGHFLDSWSSGRKQRRGGHLLFVSRQEAVPVLGKRHEAEGALSRDNGVHPWGPAHFLQYKL